MKMKILCATAAFMACGVSFANDFDHSFNDSTLRIDYVLSGKPGDVGINLKGMHKTSGWHGRKHNLEHALYAGNGDITITSLSGDTLYQNSFSSLFCEWLDLNEATPNCAECPLLVPLPKEKAIATVNLLDKYHNPIATISHSIDPLDILIRQRQPIPLPHKYLNTATYGGEHIGVAILGEGYTAEEMDQFYLDAAEAADAILSHEPFAKYADRFDFIAIETPSKESGLSIPKNGEWKDTAFKSHYSTFYSDRYLTSPCVFAMYDAMQNLPVQHIVILANTDEYGGGGIFNAYTLTSARHDTRRPVTAHEFGHSFGGLADEYFYDEDTMNDTYPTDAEPWEPNITTLVDFSSKWEDLLSKDTPIPTPESESEKYPVGVYEGGGYSFHGVYRPADLCRMRVNYIDHFCPACQAALERIILFYTQAM